MPPADTGGTVSLGASEGPLFRRHDVAMLDLDGTVYLGRQVIAGAPAAVAAARAHGMRMSFVTNNASRPANEVAGQLSALGIPCRPDEVVTSAQAAAEVMQRLVPPGSAVLVVGGPGLADAVAAAGFKPVDRSDAGARAVIQGWGPELSWRQLAEGAYALATGVPWVVTNADRTLPTARGVAPGNGSFVELLAAIAGRAPDVVAGKPAPPLLLRAMTQSSAVAPLVVGDRLDTDIEGAHAVGLPSLLVLTGVTGPGALLRAAPNQRPSFVSADLTGLVATHPPVTVDAGRWTCAGSVAWFVEPPSDGPWVLTLDPGGAPADSVDPLDDLRVCCAAAWAAADSARPWQPADGLLDRVEAVVPARPVSPSGSAVSADPESTRRS